MVTENLTIPDQIISNIPSVGTTTTTIAVAVTATTSALLAKPVADLLLKVVKPTVKKTIKEGRDFTGKEDQHIILIGAPERTSSVRGIAL